MRLVIVSLAMLGCGGGKGPATEPEKPDPVVVEVKPLTPRDIVAQSGPSIVRIEGTGPAGEQVGSGFIIDGKGTVATNLHVILGTQNITVKVADGKQYPALEVVNIDPLHDLALLRFASPSTTPAVKIGDSSKMRTGDQVVAIGNPLGVFENTVSEGLVSSVRTVCTAADVAAGKDGCAGELTLLQISAPISQGSSGGPLFNQTGEVIGVTTAINSEGQLINFAMPANYLKPLIEKPAPVPVQVFAERTKALAQMAHGGGNPDDGVPITRSVPNHELTVLDGCNGDQIAEIGRAIEEAIELGAPLYNQGNHEACFRIYENTVTKYERDATCKGVRAAMGDGLVRAQAMTTFKEKAWALRDTFDGFLLVSQKWVQVHGPLPKKQK